MCGVCRTDLHLAAGELPAKRPLVAPGHEVVGRVVEVGDAVDDVALGERLGVAWLRAHVWPVPVVPRRRGEPVPPVDVHRLGRRRRVRRAVTVPAALRLPHP